MRFVPAQTDKEFPARLSELSKEGTVEPVLLHDSTEREFPVRLIRISKKNDTAEKKRHTVKNVVVATMSCLILFVSQTVCGKTHD